MQAAEDEAPGTGDALRLDPRVFAVMAVHAEFVCLSDRNAQKQHLRQQRDALVEKLADSQREQLRYVALTLETLLERIEPSGDDRRR